MVLGRRPTDVKTAAELLKRRLCTSQVAGNGSVPTPAAVMAACTVAVAVSAVAGTHPTCFLTASVPCEVIGRHVHTPARLHTDTNIWITHVRMLVHMHN
jgi:hypothetical protein